tara:strand:+ start:69 stop:545 length:477 start_codon:yes stop_codon:yes gene_type:complete
MTISVMHTKGYTPSANEFTTVYSAPDNVEYVEVMMVQCGNTGSVDRNVSVRWTSWENRLPSSTSGIYYGDGVTLQHSVWDYSQGISTVVNEALIPGKAALSVLDSSLFLQAKDFIEMKPGSSAQMAATVVVREHYPDGATISRWDTSAVQEYTRQGIW